MVILEARVEERQSLDRELESLGEVVVSTSNVFSQVTLASPREGWEAGKHFVKDTTEGPDISRVVVPIAVENFWRHNQGSSESSLSQLTFFEFPGET